MKYLLIAVVFFWMGCESKKTKEQRRFNALKHQIDSMSSLLKEGAKKDSLTMDSAIHYIKGNGFDDLSFDSIKKRSELMKLASEKSKKRYDDFRSNKYFDSISKEYKAINQKYHFK